MLTSWQGKAALLPVINYNNGYYDNKSSTNIVTKAGEFHESSHIQGTTYGTAYSACICDSASEVVCFIHTARNIIKNY